MNAYDPLLPEASVRFQNIFNKFSRIFEKYGFTPHLTSAFCNLEVMIEASGKDDIFRIADPEGNLTGFGLRYDHTVPLEQYVKGNSGKITFPFKRYTTQPVYRTKDASQLNEFYSCDIDVLGRRKLSLAYDAEILCAVCEALEIFHNKEYNFYIELNNVKLLNGLLTHLDVPKEEIYNLQQDISDKEKLKKELAQFNSDHGYLDKVLDGFYQINGKGLDSHTDVVCALRAFEEDCQIDNPQFSEGINEIESVCKYSKQLGIDEGAVRICPTSVRSMTYYTGTIISTFLEKNGRKADNESFCHGGRYSFRGEEETFAAVGVTFNLTSLFNRMNAERLIGDDFLTTASVMVSGAARKDNSVERICSVQHAVELAKRLRKKDIETEMFLEESMSISEQIEHAKNRGFRIFLWTEEHLERELHSDDIVMRINLNEPGKGQAVMCSGLFTGIELSLHCKTNIL